MSPETNQKHKFLIFFCSTASFHSLIRDLCILRTKSIVFFISLIWSTIRCFHAIFSDPKCDILQQVRETGCKESLIKFMDAWSLIPALGNWDPDWSFPVDSAFCGWPCPCPPLYCTRLSIPANDHDERPFISLLQPPQWNKSRPPHPPKI